MIQALVLLTDPRQPALAVEIKHGRWLDHLVQGRSLCIEFDHDIVAYFNPQAKVLNPRAAALSGFPAYGNHVIFGAVGDQLIDVPEHYLEATQAEQRRYGQIRRNAHRY